MVLRPTRLSIRGLDQENIDGACLDLPDACRIVHEEAPCWSSLHLARRHFRCSYGACIHVVSACLNELCVHPRHTDQGCMGAALHHLALGEHNNFVTVADGAKTMCHNETGTSPAAQTVV